jgi:chorismate mutase/prephenate dehydratase
VSPSNHDPIIESHRAQIAALDRQVLAALNQRIHLVKRLKDHKAAHGLGFHDATQETRVLAQLAQANEGPLSEEGLRAIFALILQWSKREAAALGGTQAG